MRRALLLWLLLICLTGSLWANPHISGLLTPYPNISSSVTIRGTLYTSGAAYGMIDTPVTIIGSSFGLDGTVTFSAAPNGTGTVAATVTSWDDTTISVTVPSGAVTGTVIVTTGGQSSTPVPFIVTNGTYNASCTPSGGSGAPVIDSLSPNSGPINTLVGITGLHFGKEQGTSTVTVNGVTSFVTDWSDNTITIAVPQGAASGPVIVNVNGIASNTVYFTVTTSNSCIIARNYSSPVWSTRESWQ